MSNTSDYWYGSTWTTTPVMNPTPPPNPTPMYTAAPPAWSRAQLYQTADMYITYSFDEQVRLGNYLGISRKPLIDPDLQVDIGL